MSTDVPDPSRTPGDGPEPRPMTRAEARALREAAEAQTQTEALAAQPSQAEAPAPASPPGPPIPTPVTPLSSEEHPVGYAAPEPTKPSSHQPSSRRFLLLFASVLGVLAVVVGALSAVSLVQGPRLASVQVDPSGAVEASGSRLILTANQALAPIDESQVSIEPDVPFTIDSTGRALGVRFTVPLHDDTVYTVRVADVTGVGGGPSAVLETEFRTPKTHIFLLQRSVDGDDKIFRTDLTGQKAVAVYQHPQIDDFRATANELIVAVEEEGTSSLIAMDRDGKNERELPLPGVGYVSTLQVSDRGGLVGYTFTDKNLSATQGRASVLATQSLRDANAEPQIIEIAGEPASIASWEFVPDAAAVLFVDFDGTLSLDDRSGDAGPQTLGLAQSIQALSRGTYTAIIERTEGLFVLDLADGAEEPLALSVPDFGTPVGITLYPGGELRHVIARDAGGLPTGQAIIRVDDDGAAQPLFEVSSADSIVQSCASPSGRYAAVSVAPDLLNNPYDRSLLPMPETVQTHLIEIATGEELVVLAGFDTSWCAKGPRR